VRFVDPQTGKSEEETKNFVVSGIMESTGNPTIDEALYSDKMGEIKEKIKEKVSNTGKTEGQTSEYEEGAPGTETGRREDPLTSYREKEPMTPAKIKEHEPIAVKREMTERITESGQTGGTSQEEAAEIARKKGMAKGTAAAAETGSEYEQGAAGANK
jgi:hypothetical protein